MMLSIISNKPISILNIFESLSNINIQFNQAMQFEFARRDTAALLPGFHFTFL